MIKAYLIEFEEIACSGVRYLCDAHAKEVVRLRTKIRFKFMTRIHGDVYNKKCHLCKKRR